MNRRVFLGVISSSLLTPLVGSGTTSTPPLKVPKALGFRLGDRIRISLTVPSSQWFPIKDIVALTPPTFSRNVIDVTSHSHGQIPHRQDCPLAIAERKFYQEHVNLADDEYYFPEFVPTEEQRILCHCPPKPGPHWRKYIAGPVTYGDLIFTLREADLYVTYQGTIEAIHASNLDFRIVSKRFSTCLQQASASK